MTRGHRSFSVHYALIVAALSFLIVLTAAGIRSIPSLLFIPLEQEFHWDRATISSAVSINLILFGLCGPFAAAFAQRIGARRLITISLFGLAAAVMLTTQVRAMWQFQLLWGVAVGFGSGALGVWLAPTVANRWFAQHQGLVVGLLTAGSATGQLIFLPLLASIVVASGWRWAVISMAAVTVLMALLVLRFFRDAPQTIGIQPYGSQANSLGGSVGSGPPPKGGPNPFIYPFSRLKQDIRKPAFLVLGGTFFACGATTSGLIGTHLIPASVEHGIPEVTAAGYLALIGVLDILGTTVSGWASDRYDSRWLLVGYYGLRGVALLLLPFALGSGYALILVFIVFYGLEWVATLPPTVRLIADNFGKENVGIVVSWVVVAHQLGAGLAAYAAGMLHDALGDYTVAFLGAGFLALGASLTFIALGGAVSRRAPAKTDLSIAG